jgi:hypothetical protein
LGKLQHLGKFEKKSRSRKKTEVWFGRYNLQEIWESAQPEVTKKEKEKIQLKNPAEEREDD